MIASFVITRRHSPRGHNPRVLNISGHRFWLHKGRTKNALHTLVGGVKGPHSSSYFQKRERGHHGKARSWVDGWYLSTVTCDLAIRMG